MKKGTTELANWFFTVKTETEPKAFKCRLLSDNSCDFYFYDHYKEFHHNPARPNRLTRDESEIAKADAHQEEFTINVTGIEQRIIDCILKYDREDTPWGDKRNAQEQQIDEMLEPYFWNRVNPFLPHPLKKPRE